MNKNLPNQQNNGAINQSSIEQYPYSYTQSPTNTSNYSLINDVLKYFSKERSQSEDSIKFSEINASKENIKFSTKSAQSNSTILPQFYSLGNRIMIPAKIEYTIRRLIPKKLLKKIHCDVTTAIELCLLFLTNLTSTYFEIIEGSNHDGWKALQSKYLRSFLSTSPLTYKYIIEALKYNLDKGPILICDEKYSKGKKSYHFKLGEAFIGKGIEPYELKTQTAIELLNKHRLRIYNKGLENPICRNLYQFYKRLSLPTQGEIINEAKKHIENEVKTKNGKMLKFLNKHKRNSKKYSYVEDGLKRFNQLTEHGLIIPSPGSEKSGGRVVDSIVLMNSWIRNLIKIDGECLVECDFNCLHPNITMSNYGGSYEYVNHLSIAEEIGIDKNKVKKGHLSFFNMSPDKWKYSPVFKYYFQTQPEMMMKIAKEKKMYNYNITSKRLFSIEVSLMTAIILKLNAEGIYVGYGYDAFYCSPKEAQKVKEIMNATALEHGIKTTAKVSSE